MRMRVRWLILYLGIALFSQGLLWAAGNPCENPKAIRIGVFTMSVVPQASHADIANATFEHRFQEALENRLSNACLVHDMETFSAREDFPALKGSMVFQITAAPSTTNPKVAAIAVEMFAIEGPYIEQEFRIGCVPVLIESAADYDSGARVVIDFWSRVGKLLTESKPSAQIQ
jgi:hypothetical protein